MTITVVTSVVVYAVVTYLAGFAATKSAVSRGEATLFPITIAARLLAWAGGILCFVFVVWDAVSNTLTIASVIFLLISIGVTLLPLRSIAVSHSGISSLPVLFYRGVHIPWDSVRKVEVRNGSHLIIVTGDTGVTVTHTRFNADSRKFQSLLMQHVDRRLWSCK